MAPKLNLFDQKLAKEKKTPGPGYYENPAIVGANYADSRIPNPIASRFSRIKERFIDLTVNSSPPPNKYTPRGDCMTSNPSSRIRFARKCIFGTEVQSGGPGSLYNLAHVSWIPGPG